MVRRTRGRPPLNWLDAGELAALPHGTAVTVEQAHTNTTRTTGRILGATTGGELMLITPRGEVCMTVRDIKRGRVVPAVYQPGDPVLLRHVPASTWRGGVVSTKGHQVLVETLDGSFVWHDEDDLEPPDAREPVAPRRRGPVPSRVV